MSPSLEPRSTHWRIQLFKVPLKSGKKGFLFWEEGGCNCAPINEQVKTFIWARLVSYDLAKHFVHLLAKLQIQNLLVPLFKNKWTLCVA